MDDEILVEHYVIKTNKIKFKRKHKKIEIEIKKKAKNIKNIKENKNQFLSKKKYENFFYENSRIKVLCLNSLTFFFLILFL